MIDKIMEKIESLPPLPESITKIEEYRKKEEQTVEDLIEILEDDAFLVTTLLKVANSSMFGFNSKIETLSRLINLLGIKFTLYIAISETVQNLLSGDLEPYAITTQDLKESTTLSVNLVNLWINKFDFDLKEELILPSLLQQTGKIILSELIKENNLTEKFKEEVLSGKTVSQVERELMGITTSEMTALIFKHWKLSDNFINMIQFVDNIEKCDSEYLKRSQILKIIKIVCNPFSPLNENKVNIALQKADEYNFDTKYLENAIQTLQDRVLEAS